MSTITKFAISVDATSIDVSILSTAGRKLIGDLVLFNPKDPSITYRKPFNTYESTLYTYENARWMDDGTKDLMYGCKAHMYHIGPLVQQKVIITITSGTTASGRADIHLDGIEYTPLVSLSVDPIAIATEIAAATYVGWTVTRVDNVLTFLRSYDVPVVQNLYSIDAIQDADFTATIVASDIYAGADGVNDIFSVDYTGSHDYPQYIVFLDGYEGTVLGVQTKTSAFTGSFLMPAGTMVACITQFPDTHIGEDVAHTYNYAFHIAVQSYGTELIETLLFDEMGLDAEIIAGYMYEQDFVTGIAYSIVLLDSCYQYQAMVFLMDEISEMLEGNDGFDMVYTTTTDNLITINTMLGVIDLALQLNRLDDALQGIDNIKNKLDKL